MASELCICKFWIAVIWWIDKATTWAYHEIHIKFPHLHTSNLIYIGLNDCEAEKSTGIKIPNALFATEQNFRAMFCSKPCTNFLWTVGLQTKIIHTKGEAAMLLAGFCKKGSKFKLPCWDKEVYFYINLSERWYIIYLEGSAKLW